MGKGSWSGIWEMFAALVFYDLVTTMVMIMWKDGEVLAVQCVSALVAGAVFLFFYIRKQNRGESQLKKRSGKTICHVSRSYLLPCSELF